MAIVDEMAQLGPHMKSLENAMGMAAGAAALLGFGTELCRRSDVERLYARQSQQQ